MSETNLEDFNMTQPTNTQIADGLNIVCNGIEKLMAVRTNTSVDMMEHSAHPCNTPACHAGWIVLSAKAGFIDITPLPKKAQQLIHQYDSWYRGSYILDVLCGFDINLEFLDFHARSMHRTGSGFMGWAHDNPLIWGNDDGSKMYNSSSAFGNMQNEIFSVQKIINHYKGVIARIRATEKVVDKTQHITNEVEKLRTIAEDVKVKAPTEVLKHAI